ncbi:RAI1-domain-containing protein [Mycena kentingensis (nom. inval.)]|nr:RAI1-domain-containing protein [Mycena kentingensis (nom. inval.)]
MPPTNTPSRSLPSIRLLAAADEPNPHLVLPALLGPATQTACFSVEKGTVIVDSIRSLGYFVQPQTNIDLRRGLVEYMRKPYRLREFMRIKRLDNVLEMCLKARKSAELLNADVVTWRGILTKIALGTKIDLNVSYHDGILYVEDHATPKGRISLCDESTFMGHKFEDYCTSQRPGGPAGSSLFDLDTFWAAGITRTLGSLNLLLVGEVDCVNPDYRTDPGPQHYVELKTKLVPQPELWSNHERDRKWDVQSHLIGGTQIVAGLRSQNGIIKASDYRKLEVRETPPGRLDWLARVLQALIDHCKQNPNPWRRGNAAPLRVWRAEARKDHVNIREVTAQEIEAMNKGGVPRNGILPVSYLQGLANRKKQARV